MARQGDPKGQEMPPGWKWVLGNARVGDLYDRIFTDAQLHWSSLVVPEEQRATFAALAPNASGQSIVTYNGQLQIPQAAVGGPIEDDKLFLIFNGHRFPICDINHAIAVHRQNRCDATLIDFPQPRRRAYDEKLRLDASGNVARVDRSYDTGAAPSLQADRDWPAIIVLSGAAMRQLLNVELPQRINQWPAAMLYAGLKLRGCTIPGRAFSLHDRDHLYELNEVFLRLKPQWIAQAGDLVDQGQKIWVGKNVRIDSSAQLIGPIAIGDNVEIGPESIIVGPTSIGRNSKIGNGVVLKRCVVMPDTTLASAAQRSAAGISHAIVLGADAPTIQAITPSSDAGLGLGVDFRTLSIDRPIKLETVLEAGALPALRGVKYRAFCYSKRVVDVLGSLFFLACTLPFYPIIALAIKINSPGGGIFYGHVRQGRGGKNFRCWKFRTMIPDADEVKRRLMAKNEVDGPQFKMKDDPRIFRVGRWLRRFNMDEWPQFFCVLFGTMSLVGPRPSPDRENQMCPAWREARLSVRPGITGLWQVMRRRDRGETDFQEWIFYDVQYVKKQSIWLDVKILFRTFGVVFGSGQ